MEVVRQHDAMIEAIENKDADEAETLARIHTDLFRDRIDRYLNSNLADGITLGSRAVDKPSRERHRNPHARRALAYDALEPSSGCSICSRCPLLRTARPQCQTPCCSALLTSPGGSGIRRVIVAADDEQLAGDARQSRTTPANCEFCR